MVCSRVDRPFYKTGLELCRNFVPLLTGGLFFRPGFGYQVHSRLNADAWGTPFRFNISQSYSLEFTDYKIRFHTASGVVLETAKTITGVTQADPGVITSTSHGFSDGDEVFISGVVGMTELNSQFFLVANASTHTFTLTDIDGNDIDTSGYTAYVSGGSVARVYEIDSPYTAADARKIRYSGTADIMYITCAGYEPRKLTRLAAASWTLSIYTRYSSSILITAITQASPGVITSADHGLSGGERIYISHVEGMTELNGNEYLVTAINTSTFSLTDLSGTPINTTTYTKYTDAGDIAILRETPQNISAITKADPGVITIAGHGLSTYDKVYITGIVGMTELNDQYYWVKKIDANTFSLTDEWENDIDTSGYTTYTSGGTVTYISGVFTKIGDFPSAVGLYGGRCYMGGTENDLDGMWGSRGVDSATGSAQYDDFTIGTADDAGFVFTISSQNPNDSAHNLYWFGGTQNFLVLGMSSGVYKATGGADGQPITPTAITVTPVSSVGAADITPLFVENQIVYVEQGLQTLRSFGYSLLEDSYKAFDKNILSDEIASAGIIQIAYARGRPGLIYVVLSDGSLLTCTLREQEDVAGWARYPIGGDGLVLSVVTEPQTTGFSRVMAIIERVIDNHTRRYIEYLSEDPAILSPIDVYSGEDNKDADKLKYEKLLFEAQKQLVRLDCVLVLDRVQSIGITLSALSGSAVTVTADSALFSATDVGKEIIVKYLTGEETGAAVITAYTSSTVVTVKIEEAFSSLTFASGAWYLTTDEIKGLGHLEGETVYVVADGMIHPTAVVADGLVSLDSQVRYAFVGKRYLGIARLLDPEVGLNNGTAQAREKKINTVYFKVRNMLGLKVGPSLYNLSELLGRIVGGSYFGRPVPLISGLMKVQYTDDLSKEKKICIVQDLPLPATILAVVTSLDIGEEE